MNRQPLLSGLLTGAVVLCVASPVKAQVIEIINVQVETSTTGRLEVFLDTLSGETPQTSVMEIGNSLIIDASNAQLILPEGEFRQFDPVEGVAAIEVTQLNPNTVRIAVTGETGTPTATVIRNFSGLAFSVTPQQGLNTDFETETDIETIELVVTATRTQAEITEVPRAVTTINREQLERQADVTRDLGEILGKLVPGLAPTTQTNSVFGQPLRGRNIAVLVDGVPQGTNRNAQRDLRTIDPSAIERIEVVRGPSAIYGDGATGGVINIITRRSVEDELIARTTVGFNNSLTHMEDSFGYTLQQYVAGNADKFDYVFSGAYSTNGGFFDAEGDRVPPDPQGQGGLADLNTLNILAKAGYSINDEQRIQLTFNRFDDSQDTDFALDPTPTGDKAEAREGLVLPNQPETENTIINLDYSNDSILGSQLKAQLYYRDYLTRFSPFDLRGSAAFGNSVSQSRVESEKIGTRLDLETPLLDNDRLSVLWGLDAFNEDSSQPADLFDPDVFAASDGLVFEKIGEGILSPPIEQNNVGLFAQLSWKPIDDLAINGGIRQEFIGVSVDDFSTLGGNNVQGGDLDYDATLFNIGAIYSVTDNVSVFGSFAQGFSIADVARALRTAADGSSVDVLSPEAQTVDNYELGVRGTWNNVQGSISGFYSYSDLGTTFNADFDILRDPQRIYGIEADVNGQVAEDWQVGGTFTWTEGDRDTDDDDDFETPLQNFLIPPIKLTAYVENQTTSTWRNRFQLLYSGTRDPEGTGFGLEEVDSYLTADLISSVELGDGTLQVSVENLFNSLYFPNISQIYGGVNESAARGVRVGVSYTLTW